MTPEQEAVLHRAVMQNGAERQIEMVSEEVGELLKALNKVQRKGLLFHNGIHQPNKEMSIEKCISFYDLCSEIADVKTLISQLEFMVGSVGREAIQISQDRKIDRLEERLNKKTQ